MFRIYLSGSMAGRVAEQVQAERELATKLFLKAGIFPVDPAAAEQKLWQRGRKAKIGLQFPLRIMKAFVDQDKWLIRRCDALLVLTGDTPSDGTWREMCYAEKIGIPVIMIAPRRKRGELVGWSNIEVPHVVDDLGSAIRLIRRKWLREYENHKKYFDAAIRNAETAVGSKSKKRSKRK
jgi:nucleoside 2-deoxyribosyltransferase